MDKPTFKDWILESFPTTRIVKEPGPDDIMVRPLNHGFYLALTGFLRPKDLSVLEGDYDPKVYVVDRDKFERIARRFINVNRGIVQGQPYIAYLDKDKVHKKVRRVTFKRRNESFEGFNAD